MRKIYRVNCPSCGREILSEKRQPKLCYKCRQEVEKEKRLKSRKICPVCGRFFVPKYPIQINCSKKCALKRQTTSVILKCENCHKKIRVTPSQIKNIKKHFCSVKCFHSYLAKNRKSDRANINKNLKETILSKYQYRCFLCGKGFEQIKPLSLHHINGNSLQSKEENLIPLCKSCHRKVHIYNILSRSKLFTYKKNFYND